MIFGGLVLDDLTTLMDSSIASGTVLQLVSYFYFSNIAPNISLFDLIILLFVVFHLRNLFFNLILKLDC